VATAVIIGSRDNVTAKLKRKTMLFLDQSLIEGGVVYRPRNQVLPKQKL
jgi:hypothetical protein